jgi:hypothetical protein
MVIFLGRRAAITPVKSASRHPDEKPANRAGVSHEVRITGKFGCHDGMDRQMFLH